MVDRTVIAQGIVNNTLGVISNRDSSNVNSNVFSYPDYMLRPHSKTDNASVMDGTYSHFQLLKLNNGYSPVDSKTPNKYIEIMGNGSRTEYINLYDDFDGDYDRDFFFVDYNTVNM